MNIIKLVLAILLVLAFLGQINMAYTIPLLVALVVFLVWTR